MPAQQTSATAPLTRTPRSCVDGRRRAGQPGMASRPRTHLCALVGGATVSCASSWMRGRLRAELLQKVNTLLCVVGLNTGQTFLVSFLHLLEYLFLGHCTLWQKMPQQFFDVGTAQ